MKTDIFIDDDYHPVELAVFPDLVKLKQRNEEIFMSNEQALEMTQAIIREHALRTVKHETRGPKKFEEHVYTLNEGDYWEQVKVIIDGDHAGLYVAGSSKSGAGVKEYLSKLKVVLNAIKEL